MGGMCQEWIPAPPWWWQSREWWPWCVTGTIHHQDYEIPSRNSSAGEALEIWKAQKAEPSENWEFFPREISKWDKIVICSAFKFPGSSLKPTQDFPFFASSVFKRKSSFFALPPPCFPLWETHRSNRETGRAAEEKHNISLIKRKLPNKSSSLLHSGEPVALSLQEIFIHIVMGTESLGKHSHFPVEKRLLQFRIWRKRENPRNILLGFFPPAFSHWNT